MLELTCPKCEKRLQVADEHRGQPVRCPICQTISHAEANLPAESKPEQTTIAADEVPRWFLRTPEGQIYGAVTRSELDDWVRQGRVTYDCQLREGEQAKWEFATGEYPILQPQIVRRAPLVAESTAYAASPNQIPTADHRGVVILICGIAGWTLTCPVFSVLAWTLGTSDLREIREGRMDGRGEQLTQVGRILGMSHTILSIVLVIAALFAGLVSQL